MAEAPARGRCSAATAGALVNVVRAAGEKWEDLARRLDDELLRLRQDGAR